MSPEEAATRVASLRTEIRRHDYLYYVRDSPTLDDAAYDRLFEELKQLEETFPHLVTPDSPTLRVGGELLEGFESVQHTAPMLSLDSSQDEAALRRFDDRLRKSLLKEGDSTPVEYVIDPKLDGLSVELVYQDGVFLRAATRGDGRKGEAITENVRTIAAVPLRLRNTDRPVPKLLAVRGEIILQLAGFEKLNESLVAAGKDPFANPRNAAAGTMRQLDPQITASRPLDVYVYDILAMEPAEESAAPSEITSQWQVLEALRDWGLRVNDRPRRGTSVEDILQYHREIGAARDDLPYEIDGIVIKLDALTARERVGMTSRFPRWAYAFKFPPRQEATRIEDIIAGVGRTGVITPVAVLEPVLLGGVTVSRATLHNREEVARKDVRPGDLVRVQRAGDVIPQVIERVEEPDRDRGEPFRMPETCPSCSTVLVERGPFTVCPNSFECPAQLAARLTHFGSRNALDIEGLGEETAKALIDQGLVRQLPQLFDLRPLQLLELEGFAEKSATNLVAAIAKAAHAELPRFLFGLGIPEVGVTVARELARHFRTLEAFRQATDEELQEISGVGPRMAEEIRAFFDQASNQKVLDELLDGRLHLQAMPQTAETADGNAPFEAKTFVFTGGMERFSRPQAAAAVEKGGGKVVSSVSRKTGYVVVGADPGSKYKKAQDLGVEILDEAAFLELLTAHDLVS
ncbi:MAG: NAD-dependent DNA ligase LigA [Deltaproteobacteria bacterium]|nr:NAD-dependent DNA ligase LigA [Deltaproteobacteria bacterium]